MSDDKTRDPIDVARKVWPGLEWSGGPHGAVGTSSEPSPDFVVLALRLRDGQERVRVEFDGAMLFANITAPAGGLRAALTEALKINPDPAEALYFLARVHEHAGEWQQAAEAYRNAYEKSPAGKSLTEQ